jgi:hypothetical protein
MSVMEQLTAVLAVLQAQVVVDVASARRWDFSSTHRRAE